MLSSSGHLEPAPPPSMDRPDPRDPRDHVPSGIRPRPELLAPAGCPEALAAALAGGADAVYFGLEEGFNARARASNFRLEQLGDTVRSIHARGVRAFLALNTLVFEPELEAVEVAIRAAAEAGVDAILVQDPAVALLASAAAPALAIHGSTQMTVSSAEGAAFARSLGVVRVVLPRELSVAEIARLAGQTDLELEVFVHGALCVSWSGQCLTSEAAGGRSANRGQCAQSCRMPWDPVVDGDVRNAEGAPHLLSPGDLAGAGAVPELLRLGVRAFKIEGRQKNAQYVATATAGYRQLLDDLAAGRAEHEATARFAEAARDMALSYSRGFTTGFLGGADHQSLVDGLSPAHRGLLLGHVVSVEGRDVLLRPAAPPARPGPEPAPPEPRPGLGIVLDDGSSAEHEAPGGPIFRATREGALWRLGFGAPGPDLARVRPGAAVSATQDPAVSRRVRSLLRSEPREGRMDVHLTVSGDAGAPLTVTATCRAGSATATTSESLALARGAGLDHPLLAGKLGAFGGTPFRLASLAKDRLAEGLFVPVSELKDLRRRIVAELEALVHRSPQPAGEGPTAPALRARLFAAVRHEAPPPSATAVVPLCRTGAQLAAALDLGFREVELDWMEMVGLGRAVALARSRGATVVVATVRVQKPGEEGYDSRIAALAPDGVLVRHWGAFMHFAGCPRPDGRPVVHGDFSLNVTNSITALHLLSRGLDTVTAAHDLDEAQLLALLDHVPPHRIAVTVHHHIPAFHTEHCVYAHILSSGRDHRTCGRPCEAHEVGLRDHTGVVHPVIVDVGCRNTIFHGRAQCAAHLAPRLIERGVRRLRVELVREDAAETAAVLGAWSGLAAGRITPGELLGRVAAHEQFGVTRGTLAIRV